MQDLGWRGSMLQEYDSDFSARTWGSRFALLRRRVPVQKEPDRGKAGVFSINVDQEAAIGSDVVLLKVGAVDSALSDSRLEQQDRDAGLDRCTQRDRYGHQLPGGRNVVQLLAISPPPWRDPTRGGHQLSLLIG
jgi:hypothetical protein